MLVHVVGSCEPCMSFFDPRQGIISCMIMSADRRACGCRGAAAARNLCRVLDDMHAAGAKLGDRYILESGEDRIVGTQGVVQFASLPRTMVGANLLRPLHRCANVLYLVA